MVTRKYEQRLRAESAEETRRRILDAVADRLRSAPIEPINLEQIAQTARVSRSTIYLVFGSRAGLFDAFVEDLWARTGLPALTKAVSAPDAREHLRAGLNAASRMYAADRDVYRALYSMSRLDPATVGNAVARMETERTGGMAYVARRLSEDGLLRPELTVRAAADILWVICSFDALDLLLTGRKLSLTRAIDTLIEMAERSLFR